jgi:rare lipoprotein A
VIVLQFSGCSPAPRFSVAKPSALPSKPAPAPVKTAKPAAKNKPHHPASKSARSVKSDTMRFGMQMPAVEEPAADSAEAEVMRVLGEGVAAYYGPGLNGRKTASGERFDMQGLTAAHRTLPFGTRVRVTCLRNGKSVIVRVNDRGPFDRGKVIDLSLGAAQRIGLDRMGVTRVKLEVVQ